MPLRDAQARGLAALPARAHSVFPEGHYHTLLEAWFCPDCSVLDRWVYIHEIEVAQRGISPELMAGLPTRLTNSGHWYTKSDVIQRIKEIDEDRRQFQQRAFEHHLLLRQQGALISPAAAQPGSSRVFESYMTAQQPPYQPQLQYQEGCSSMPSTALGSWQQQQQQQQQTTPTGKMADVPTSRFPVLDPYRQAVWEDNNRYFREASLRAERELTRQQIQATFNVQRARESSSSSRHTSSEHGAMIQGPSTQAPLDSTFMHQASIGQACCFDPGSIGQAFLMRGPVSNLPYQHHELKQSRSLSDAAAGQNDRAPSKQVSTERAVSKAFSDEEGIGQAFTVPRFVRPAPGFRGPDEQGSIEYEAVRQVFTVEQPFVRQASDGQSSAEQVSTDQASNDQVAKGRLTTAQAPGERGPAEAAVPLPIMPNLVLHRSPEQTAVQELVDSDEEREAKRIRLNEKSRQRYARKKEEKLRARAAQDSLKQNGNAGGSTERVAYDPHGAVAALPAISQQSFPAEPPTLPRLPALQQRPTIPQDQLEQAILQKQYSSPGQLSSSPSERLARRPAAPAPKMRPESYYTDIAQSNGHHSHDDQVAATSCSAAMAPVFTDPLAASKISQPELLVTSSATSQLTVSDVRRQRSCSRATSGTPATSISPSDSTAQQEAGPSIKKRKAPSKQTEDGDDEAPKCRTSSSKKSKDDEGQAVQSKSSVKDDKETVEAHKARQQIRFDIKRKQLSEALWQRNIDLDRIDLSQYPLLVMWVCGDWLAMKDAGCESLNDIVNTFMKEFKGFASSHARRVQDSQEDEAGTLTEKGVEKSGRGRDPAPQTINYTQEEDELDDENW